MLKNHLKDTVALEKRDGQRVEKIRAAVTGKKIIIDNGDLPIEEGDVLERILPNGLVERYTVLDRGYFAAFGSQPPHYQVQVEKQTSIQRKSGGTTIYNVTGPNARVNVESTDASTNVVTIAPSQLFEQLRSIIEQKVRAESERDDLLRLVEELAQAKTATSYLGAYQGFIASAANHMTVLAPFLPALAQLANR